MNDSIESTIFEIFNLYEKFGTADYIGEPVSQIEHMSQSAQLAMREGCSDEVILAAFFHDIGHLCTSVAETRAMNGYGIKSHEQIGSDYLRSKGFPENVARLVENHVQAKRYLTFKYPEYYTSLSEASRHTLNFQGGVMQAEEAAAFELDPLFHESIALRRWDEQAKEINVPIVDLDVLKQKARTLLQNNDQSSRP
jgi:2-amino-1-hydroxyethylphosphonate dioxygenase (glycine-forming)